MKRGRYRAFNVAAIAVSFGISLFGTWYTRTYGRGTIFDYAGLLGLISYLFFQAAYNILAEVFRAEEVFELGYLKADLKTTKERIVVLKSEVATLNAKVTRLQTKVDAIPTHLHVPNTRPLDVDRGQSR